MKSNAPKRKIFDAVDLLTEDTSAQVLAGKRKMGLRCLESTPSNRFMIIHFICMRETGWKI